MNSFFEGVFNEARNQFLEDVTPTFDTQNELFSQLPRKHRFYRMPYFSGRRYYTMHMGEPYLLSGLTAITKKIIAFNDEDSFLEKWKMDMTRNGNDPDEFADRASLFGTLIHIVAANIFAARSKGESFSTHSLDRELLSYMRDIGISQYYFKEWYKNLCGAIRSLNAFYSKSEMKVLSIEHCVADFENNICTAIDVIAEITTEESVDVPMKTKAGTKKAKEKTRKMWALNIKARNNSDRRYTDKYQLCAEQYLANNYLDIVIDKTGVLSPVWNWRSKENADCKLHDFTGAFTESEWKKYVKIFKEAPNNVNKELFAPDMNIKVSDSNVFVIADNGNILDMPEETIYEFIARHFSDGDK